MTRVPMAHRLSCTFDEACAATGIDPEELDKEIAAGHVWTATIGERRLIIVASLLQLLSDMARPACRRRHPTARSSNSRSPSFGPGLRDVNRRGLPLTGQHGGSECMRKMLSLLVFVKASIR
jgi:hypothetical protein